MVVDYLEYCDLLYMLHLQFSFGVWISFYGVLDVAHIFGHGYVVSIQGCAYVKIWIQDFRHDHVYSMERKFWIQV